MCVLLPNFISEKDEPVKRNVETECGHKVDVVTFCRGIMCVPEWQCQKCKIYKPNKNGGD